MVFLLEYMKLLAHNIDSGDLRTTFSHLDLVSGETAANCTSLTKYRQEPIHHRRCIRRPSLIRRARKNSCMGPTRQRRIPEKTLQGKFQNSPLFTATYQDPVGLEPHRQSLNRTHTINKPLSQFRRRRTPNLGLRVPRDTSRRRSTRSRRGLRSWRLTGTR